MSKWVDMGAGVNCAPTGVLYVNGKEFGMVELPRFISESDGIEQWETTYAPVECTWTALEPEPVVLNIHEAGPMLWHLWATGQLESMLLFEHAKLGSYPKRPPDPERPFWAVNPGRTRRNAFGATRRVK